VKIQSFLSRLKNIPCSHFLHQTEDSYTFSLFSNYFKHCYLECFYMRFIEIQLEPSFRVSVFFWQCFICSETLAIRKLSCIDSGTKIVVMGPGQKFLTQLGRVKFLLLGSGRVSHLWFGYGFGKFPLEMSNFSIFGPSGQKKCHRVGSKSTRVSAGQKYVRVGSGRVRPHLYVKEQPCLRFKGICRGFFTRHPILNHYCSTLECFMLVMGSGQKFWPGSPSLEIISQKSSFFNFLWPAGSGRVKFLLLGSGQPYLWFGYGFGIFPLKMLNFQFLALRVRKNVIGLGWKVPGSEPGGLLFTVGQKGRVGSGQGPSLKDSMYSNWVASASPGWYAKSAYDRKN